MTRNPPDFSFRHMRDQSHDVLSSDELHQVLSPENFGNQQANMSRVILQRVDLLAHRSAVEIITYIRRWRYLSSHSGAPNALCVCGLKGWHKVLQIRKYDKNFICFFITFDAYPKFDPNLAPPFMKTRALSNYPWLWCPHQRLPRVIMAFRFLHYV